MTVSIWVWLAFFAFVVVMLALDLGVFNKGNHTPTFKKSLQMTGLWILLAFIFAAGLWYFAGSDPAVDFITGYLLEESLSIDNLFIFVLVFSFFNIAPKYQHRVLFWGVFGALIMRVIFIVGGAALLHRFEWLMYLFGVFLIYTGAKMLFDKQGEQDLARNPIMVKLQKWLPIKETVTEPHFLVRENGKTYATKFLLALIFIEASDLLFAVDSIPAVLAVTQETFIVVTSNIFAILGLRSIYFVLSEILPMFRFIKYALAIILAFIGLKMIVNELGPVIGWQWEISNLTSLGVIVGLLIISIVASILIPKHKE